MSTLLSNLHRLFYLNATATTELYPLSLHDALPISTPLKLLLDTDCEDLEQVLAVNLVGPFRLSKAIAGSMALRGAGVIVHVRSEEHTSELQSRRDLVCRLLLEKKKNMMSHQSDVSH